MIRRLLLFALLITAKTTAQSGDARLDSIFTKYVSAHEAYLAEEIHTAIADTTAGEKCGFPARIELMNSYERLSAEQKQTFEKLQFGPYRDAYLISPDGFFRINYDTAGTHAPKYNPALTVHQNAALAALAFDSSYAFEVHFLGFPPPPLNTPYYDVYISNLPNYYGETVTDGQISGEKYYSYILVDNDFSNYYTKGTAALNVTAAHEFHHAIQIGNYGFPNDNDIFFLELTSTSMEEFVFDEVNDYYNYLRHYFNSPHRSFADPADDGYSLCIWNIYLQQKLGYDEFKTVIKRQWELFEGIRSVYAISQSLLESGLTFKEELAEFSVWNYFTKHRAAAGKYYDEAAEYPLIKPYHTTPTIPLSLTMSDLYPLSSNYIYIDTQSELDNDTLTVILTNNDVDKGLAGIADLSAVYSFNNYVYDDGVLKVNSSLSSANAGYWTASYIYDNMPYIPGYLGESELDYPFPNPYKYSYKAMGTEISIPIKNKKLDKANLNIYSVSGSLVYNGAKMIVPFSGTFVIRWSGLDNNNNKLPAGIYFYAAECDGEIYKGKIAIFNE